MQFLTQEDEAKFEGQLTRLRAQGGTFRAETILACNKTPGTQLAIATSPDISFNVELIAQASSLPLAAPGGLILSTN